MNEFLDAICQSLRSVGLEATWSGGTWHNDARLKVAGVEFHCYQRRARRPTVVIDYQWFTRPARGAYDAVAAVQHIIERLPKKLADRDRQKTAAYYKEAAAELKKRRGDMEGVTVSHTSDGVTVSLTYADPLRASMLLDFLEDQGMQPAMHEVPPIDWAAIEAEAEADRKQKAVEALEGEYA